MSTEQKKKFWCGVSSFVICLLSFFLIHPYQGISGDAALYLKNAIYGISPERFAGDLFFIGTSQDAFSLFSFLYRPLILLLGSYNATFFLATVSIGLWIFASLFFIRRWTTNVFPVFVFFAVIEYSYGQWVRIGEYLCTARTVAEALAILGFAFLFRQKRWKSLVFFLLGTLFHPLMAGWGLPVWLFFFYPKTVVPIGILSLLFPLTGLLDVSLFATYDSVWAASITEFYPKAWDLVWLGVLVAILVLAYRIFFQRERRFFRSFLLVLAIAAYWDFAGLAFKNVFLVVSQPWRIKWVLIFLAVFSVGYFGKESLKPRRLFRLFRVHPVSLSLLVGCILFSAVTVTLKTLLSSDFEFNGGVSPETLLLVWPQSLLVLFSVITVFLFSKGKCLAFGIIYAISLGVVAATLFYQGNFGKSKPAFDEMDTFLKQGTAPFESTIKGDYDKMLYFCEDCSVLGFLSATYYGPNSFLSISRERFLEARRRTARILDEPEVETRPFEFPYYGFIVSERLDKPETFSRLLESGEIRYVVSDKPGFLGKVPLDSIVLPVSLARIYLFGK